MTLEQAQLSAEGRIARIELSKLLFDTENFRLRDEDQGKSQRELMLVLEREEFDLVVIGRSLVDNGYFEAEPLVVVPKTKEGRESMEKGRIEEVKEFIVVEGNRRLGALKLITEPGFRKSAIKGEQWNALARENKNDFTLIPCVPYLTKDKVLRFLGYRHIAGINTWDPYQKARFVDYFINQSKGKTDFKQVGREIGVGPQIARSIYITFRILVYARDKLHVDTSYFEAEFSVLRAGLGSAGISRFIGLVKGLKIEELKQPVPSSKAAELKELLRYVYGTKDQPSVLPESRDLTDLGRILDNKTALKHLRDTGNDYNGALELIGGRKDRLVRNLAKAGDALDDSLRDAHHFTKDVEVTGIWKRVKETIAQLERVFS